MPSSSDVRRHVFGPLAAGQAGPGHPGAGGDRPDPAAAERLAAAAWEEGFRAGHDEGLRRAVEEQRRAVERLAELVRQARVEHAQLLHDLERQVVGLVLDLAEKVIEREARADPTVVCSVVRAALDELQDATAAQVRVHPTDHDLVASHWVDLAREPLTEGCRLVADERVEPGGCLIETQLSQVDAQLSAKLAQIRTTFQALLEGEPV
jgi:flagellar assembly protein FliH